MTKENNIDTTEENAPIAENTTVMSGAAVPPAGENIAHVDNTPEKNSLAVQEEHYPASQNAIQHTLTVEQEKDPNSMTVAELQAEQYKHGLNVSQQQALNEKLAPENKDTGNLSQKLDNKDYDQDVKPYQLEEGDIIDVMYKGFIKDLMSVDAWTRKHAYRFLDNAIYGIDNRRARRQQEKEAQKADDKKNTSNTSNQDTSKQDEKPSVLDKAYAENYEKIKNEMDKELSTIKDISEAIKDGTLFDEDKKDLLNNFQKINQNDAKTFEAVKEACDKKDNKEAREKMAKEFFAYNGGTAWFNFSNQFTANNLAYAEMSHRAKHEDMNAQQMEQEFAKTHASFHDHIQSATAEEQKKAKDKVSTSTALDKKVLSKINITDLYADSAPKTKGMKQMGQKAVEYAELNADISERNPYVSGMRHRMKMPETPTTQHVFSGGTLQDAVGYMSELRADTLQTTSPLQNHDNYHHEMVGKHLEKLNTAGSNEEILKQLRSKNQGGRE